jgi:transposase
MTVDRGQLTLMAEQVQKTLGMKNITIIADKGYFSRNDIKSTQDLSMTANVPQSDTSGAAKKGLFNKSLFKYDAHQDIYICPAGEELPHRRNVTEDGLEQKVYVNHVACRDCTIRAKCTTQS